MLISNTFTISVGTFLTNRSSRTGSSAAKSVLFVEAKSMSIRSLSWRNSSGGSCDAHCSGSPRPCVDLRLGEQVAEVDVVDERLELPGRVGRGQEVLQVAADERLVVVRRGSSVTAGEVGVQVGRELRATSRLRAAALAMYGRCRGSCQVFEEEGLVVTSPASGRGRGGGTGRGP